MILFRVALATLAVASFVEGGVVSPLHKGSNGDQYERRWGGGSVPQVEMERFHDEDATDRKHVPTKDSEESPRRHFGSGDTNNFKFRPYIDNAHEKHQHKSANDGGKNRNKRTYYPYTQYNYQVPQFQSLNAWKPAVYPLQRPYYIPVFGGEGRIPIYIPQQPIYSNPETMPHNPENLLYVGPTNRFGGNDDDDRPIWDNEEEQSVSSTTETSIRRKRKPVQSGSKTIRPSDQINHSDTSSYNHLSAIALTMPTTTTEPTAREPPGLSKCVLAIVSCCSTASKVANIKCFKQFGCAGPFWDVSPCEKKYVKSAIQKASNFYKSKS